MFYNYIYFNKVSYADKNTSYYSDVSVNKEIKKLKYALGTSLNSFMRIT